jgi:TetR/AcrR family transcriptional regulator, cholesterol catabolism regulator
MSGTRRLVEEEILRVAAACFSQRGYQATTLEEIASQVGISRVTFYTYFKNKEALLKKIFDGVLVTYQKGLEEILTASLPRREKLRRTVAHQITCITTDQAARFFLSEEKNLPPHIAKYMRAAQEKNERLIEQEILGGIKRGEIIDANPRLLTYAFIGMCNWLYRWYTSDDSIPAEEIAETFTRILESGSLVPQQAGSLPAQEQLSRLEKSVGEIKAELKNVTRSLSHGNAKSRP